MAEEQDPQPRRIPPTLSIWPPSQRTRDAVVRRLVETLTAPSSALAKRFGVVSSPEAESAAEDIEKEALEAVKVTGEGIEDGIDALQTYSKEISERVLRFAKVRKEGENAKDDEEGKEEVFV